MLGIFLAGTAPGISLLSYFYLRDKYEPEPILMVFRTFIFGAMIILPIAFIEYILKTENINSIGPGNAFFTMGMLEEIFKWMVLYFFAYRHEEFDEPFDGIVYGTSIALGFATVENIIYIISNSNGLEYALNRAFFPVSSHALFGVVMGYYISKAKFTAGTKWGWMVLSILIPSILHGIYNSIFILQTSWFMIMIPYMIFLWWYGMRKVQRAEILSKNYFIAKSEYTKE